MAMVGSGRIPGSKDASGSCCVEPGEQRLEDLARASSALPQDALLSMLDDRDFLTSRFVVTALLDRWETVDLDEPPISLARESVDVRLSLDPPTLDQPHILVGRCQHPRLTF
jgi:hypothetical protein